VTPGGAVVVLAYGGGVSFVLYWTVRIWADNRHEQLCEQARQRAMEARVRAKADRLRDLIDDAAEEARAVEEAEFFGRLAQSPLRETWAAILALDAFDPADWWVVSS
jgi:hypothetical protein